MNGTRCMKKLIPLLFMLALMLIAPVSPTALYGQAPAPAAPGAGMMNSPHDFTNDSNNSLADGTKVVGACTFCHTPHRALQSRLLWNHTLPNTDYTWTDISETIGGTP